MQTTTNISYVGPHLVLQSSLGCLPSNSCNVLCVGFLRNQSAFRSFFKSFFLLNYILKHLILIAVRYGQHNSYLLKMNDYYLNY